MPHSIINLIMFDSLMIINQLLKLVFFFSVDSMTILMSFVKDIKIKYVKTEKSCFIIMPIINSLAIIFAISFYYHYYFGAF